MAYCLPKFAADALRQKITSGEITPDSLSRMTSEERRNAFAFLGEEHASKTNAIFESKLLLKNQKQGMITWAKQVLGMKHPVYRDVLARVEKMSDVMDKTEIDAFLEDLVAYKLGMKVTQEELGNLISLSKKLGESKAKLPKEFDTMPQHEYLKKETPEQMEARLEYGVAYETFKKYSESLSPRSKDIGLGDFNPKHPVKMFGNIGAVAKSMKASIDNSFWLTQGIPALFNPRLAPIWAKNFSKSFLDFSKGLRGISSSDAVRAEIYSRPDAVNGLYARERLAIGLRAEEAYPTSLPERIPIIGRMFSASSEAYQSATLRMRADIADYYNRLARIQGVDLTNVDNARAIGHVANSLTGRGSLGTGEASLNTLNNLMFAPRLVKGVFDVVTAHRFDKAVMKSEFARKQAAKQLMSMVATYVATMQIIDAMYPGTTELDPRDAHFGQIKTGRNTYTNVIGPFRPLVRTLATLTPTFHKGKLGFWRKTSKGEWTGVEIFPKKVPEYGSFTPLDVAETFFEGKASPLLSRILTHWRGSDYAGEPPTVESDVRGLLSPMTIDSYMEDSGSKSSEAQDYALRNAVLNAFGAGTNTQK